MVLLSTDLHPSILDPEDHYTVDCYTDNDEPYGTIHVYEGCQRYRAYEGARAKVKAVGHLPLILV
jgi:hypothetical protein